MRLPATQLTIQKYNVTQTQPTSQLFAEFNGLIR
jgi:hypothetical protein